MVAVARDPETARAMASWWVVTHLTGMGPIHGRTLRRLGLGAAVDAVLEANPIPRSTQVPPAAQVLVDELVISGNAGNAGTGRADVESWFDAGA